MNYNATAVIKTAREILDSKGITHYNDTVFLLEKVLGKKCSVLSNIELSETEYNEYMSLISRRAERESMDSLMGYTEFMGLVVPFSQDTLSPRQETEIMVDNIIRENRGRNDLTVLDLCSGSGCIGLSIAKHLPAKVTLVDISYKAISMAKKTAELNNIAVEIIESDLFDNVTGKYDIIITNPPYKYAQQFVEHALELIPEGNRVAMFLKLTFLESKNRKEMFEKYPPEYISVSSSRLQCALGGDFEKFKSTSSAAAYGWFIWRKGFTGEPRVRWFN